MIRTPPALQGLIQTAVLLLVAPKKRSRTACELVAGIGMIYAAKNDKKPHPPDRLAACTSNITLDTTGLMKGEFNAPDGCGLFTLRNKRTRLQRSHIMCLYWTNEGSSTPESIFRFPTGRKPSVFRISQRAEEMKEMASDCSKPLWLLRIVETCNGILNLETGHPHESYLKIKDPRDSSAG